MKYFHHWVIEFFLVIFHPILALLNYVLPFDAVKKSKKSKKSPIILVERWFIRNPLHYCMKIYLERRGFAVYSVSFPLMTGNFEKSARDLKTFIDDKKLDDVILVGISSGGLTCYQYLTDFDGWKKTKLCIGVGAPFQGAKQAHLLYGFEIKKELDPQGKYIQSILKKPMKHGDRIYSIVAELDQAVGHENSYLPGSQKVVIDVAGHNLLHTIWLPTFRKVTELCNR
ncbi:hypothetical protein KBC70_02860 [Candidatus Woesebacteria bacterium]|nr:hypothetical protein [Candidatus Woesebacteria bacterium]